MEHNGTYFAGGLNNDKGDYHRRTIIAIERQHMLRTQKHGRNEENVSMMLISASDAASQCQELRPGVAGASPTTMDAFHGHPETMLSPCRGVPFKMSHPFRKRHIVGVTKAPFWGGL